MNRSDLLSIAKPILFNVKMIKAILNGQKTCTRRVVNINLDVACLTGKDHEFIRDDFTGDAYTGYVCKHCGFGVAFPHGKYPVGTSFIRPRYNIGDTLYVRETWNTKPSEIGGGFIYRASMEAPELYAWKPSIHMPKEAARIFLRVVDVRLERLQDIMKDPPGPNNQVAKEGFNYGCDFIATWQNTIPKTKRSIYGYDANPWVWVYEFKKLDT